MGSCDVAKPSIGLGKKKGPRINFKDKSIKEYKEPYQNISLIEINQNVTITFAINYGSIYNYKIKFNSYWSLLQLCCNY
jgi:hypothetical protein